MVTKKLTAAEWMEHLATQASGACSQAAYCAKNELSLSAFRYWKKRCANIAKQKDQELVEVAPQWVTGVHDLCAISFPNGCTVRLRTANSIGLISALAKEFGLS
ncbi:MAG: hypothetical protein A2087_06175 [Spirochaetes bacterium GWD1_61_31]|nr:MAG: hypothetical protein A2Y37_01190 [Spirochaetes bacterium GWB1_60_80]OHD35224.1 MAG: hypothetical protein A2004_11345 [Spirochaetes bacterium GWC1_61_12]OHD41780.1 MAG: hypothetical protein A2087_06175 [Spirochaetes bacterium GWD1_61_31]OHD42586.1 MAG: hypothetical protein A2Y35_07695 [Spirochaetes bacterium GWE1_60_18]OHD59815.1 MAG: hypothetical protein A2Y32_01460 [Spirochaetes bacterium GWF1_60_12]